ncbi:MAG: MATE family efflux transporter [Eubacteriales bacterium]
MNSYLIQKKPLSAILLFSLPLIIGNFFQQFYTLIDSAVVGRYVGETALAAVGASYALTNIFIFVALGGGMGASVVVSRHFGEKDFSKMKSAVYTAMISFLSVSVVLGIIGLLFGRSIMTLLKTPAEALDIATEYLNIYFIGLPLLFMYNITSSMFNALGKSKIPLVFLIFSSVLNIILDYYMVTSLGMGVAGVAWATLIAQGLSALLSFAVFMFEMKRVVEKPEKIFDTKELSVMTKIALPSIFQQSAVSIGMLLVQSVVNSFGTESLAGFSASARVESLVIVPMIALGNALSSYTAQNLGAGKEERVSKGYRTVNIMVAIFAVIICIVLECFGEQIISIFLGDDGTKTAISVGSGYVNFVGWFYCLIGFKMAVDGVLRGAGDMKIFTIANFINLGMRVILAVTLAPKFGIEFVWYAVPIGWFLNFVISFAEYKTGKWKNRMKPSPEAIPEKTI